MIFLDAEIVGQIIEGSYGEIVIRKKSGVDIELGELLVAENTVFQVFDLEYGSLHDSKELALMSGSELEGFGETHILDEEIRNFVKIRAKPLVDMVQNQLYLRNFQDSLLPSGK